MKEDMGSRWRGGGDIVEMWVASSSTPGRGLAVVGLILGVLHACTLKVCFTVHYLIIFYRNKLML
jgi:hypothetical protein